MFKFVKRFVHNFLWTLGIVLKSIVPLILLVIVCVFGGHALAAVAIYFGGLYGYVASILSMLVMLVIIVTIVVSGLKTWEEKDRL